MATPLKTARRWFAEVWQQRRSETIHELSAPGTVGHLSFGETQSAEDLESFQAAFFAACLDLQVEIEDAIESGAHVVIRWEAKGTHQHDAFGVTAKQKAFFVRGMTWLRVQDGRITEAWDCWDFHGLLKRWAE